MNNTAIKQLVEKYFEGETSLVEEQQLRAYFKEGEVAEDLKTYQPLFQYFATAKKEELPSHFDERVVVKLQPPAKRRFMRRMVQMSSVAASVMLVIGAYFWYNTTDVMPPVSNQINWEQYEITDEKEAYKETKAALKLLSRNLNKGAKKAAKSMDRITKKKRGIEN